MYVADLSNTRPDRVSGNIPLCKYVIFHYSAHSADHALEDQGRTPIKISTAAPQTVPVKKAANKFYFIRNRGTRSTCHWTCPYLYTNRGFLFND
jgi:hypothetical protein